MVYRIQFLDEALRIKSEWRINASDVETAVALTKVVLWPADAVWMQILDDSGRVVHHERLRDDR